MGGVKALMSCSKEMDRRQGMSKEIAQVIVMGTAILCVLSMKKIAPDNKGYKYYAMFIVVAYLIFLNGL